MEATLTLSQDAILEAVRNMYTEVAACPSKGYHFPTGRAACLYVGYPEDELDRTPAEAVESFAGVGYPFAARIIGRGDTVVDIGSGSGTDLFFASRAVGEQGHVIGIDMTDAMISKARTNLSAAGITNVEVRKGDATEIPVASGTVDVVTSNGVLNLVPDKDAAFREIHRVLRPGGRVQISDIVLLKSVSAKSKSNPQLWAECIVGAEPEQDYLEIASRAGFTEITVIDRLDYFANSSNESTRRVAGDLGAHTIVFTAVKA